MPPPRPAPTVPDEDFFSLIQKVQSSRLEEQRTTLPKLIPETTGKKKKKQPQCESEDTRSNTCCT